MNVLSVDSIKPSQASDVSSANSASAAQNSFSETLGKALDKVNESQQTADQMVTGLASNSSSQDLHNVMIAMQKANILLQATVQVRDKVIDAYKEVMGMQV
ncbi:flagellar hook-basal body complex protein FliE [Terrilactibacillus sp. S3-3]|nr:flagellar hook-basal body complex protein FliE [Terrilactibacillus sp. S3-3]